jgi:hypothetical protein
MSQRIHSPIVAADSDTLVKVTTPGYRDFSMIRAVRCRQRTLFT